MFGAQLRNHLLLDECDEVNKIISSIGLHAQESIICDVSNHMLGSGGKRLRSLFTLLSASIVGTCNIKSVKLAAAVELIHNATLLHDDVIDGGITRRGLKTANLLWGNKISILVGDYLFSQAFICMVETGLISALDVLARTSSLISKAEVTQLRMIAKTSTSLDDYIQLITEKTAALFAAACKVGAISSGANQSQIDAMYHYGLNFGIIFQIIDDYLDYFSDAQSAGKMIGSDMQEQKVTLPIILLLECCNTEEQDILQKFFAYSEEAINLQYIIALLKKHNIAKKISAIIYSSYYIHCDAVALTFANNDFMKYMHGMTDAIISQIQLYN